MSPSLPQIRVGLLVLLTCVLSTCAPKSASHPAEPSVRTFLNRYFESWSARDMETYGSLFDPRARIFYMAGEGQVISHGLTDFVHGQRMAHEKSLSPMKEVPLEMRIQMDDKAAQAQVTWLLTKQEGEERGTDLFTLRRDGKSWKIISLVYYAE
jgi:hypothetical protein